jgi:arsenate reductase
MKLNVEIWHNKKCSNSRKVLELLESSNAKITIRDYIKNPPSISELQSILKMLGKQPEFILRKKDKVFQELFCDHQYNQQEWLEAMQKHPSIIERPIVIIGQKAYLARPFEEFTQKFEKLLNK